MAPHSSVLAWRIPWTEGAWQATVHGVTKSQTPLSNFHLHLFLLLLYQLHFRPSLGIRSWSLGAPALESKEQQFPTVLVTGPHPYPWFSSSQHALASLAFLVCIPGLISMSEKSHGFWPQGLCISYSLSSDDFFLPFTSLMTPHPQLSPKMTLATSTFLDSQVLLFDIPESQGSPLKHYFYTEPCNYFIDDSLFFQPRAGKRKAWKP